ncbi:hypothetical protein [Flavobacterium sp.]|uniref:hypothetical protein n=1 Tax=Flavobacterium sp. TaxID=239 RepID=UPI003753563D
MKKFFLSLIICFSVFSYSQKRVLINNLSTLPVTIIAINTVGTSNAQYPSIRSETPSNLIIPASQSRTMQSPTSNVTQFPFNSTSSSIQYTSWRRFTSGTTSSTAPNNSGNITTLYGNGNKFNFAEITVGTLNYKIGTGLNNSSSTSFTGTSGTTNFTITYSENVIAPGNIQYIIQIN